LQLSGIWAIVLGVMPKPPKAWGIWSTDTRL
jgi:hypothetical protein